MAWDPGGYPRSLGWAKGGLRVVFIVRWLQFSRLPPLLILRPRNSRARGAQQPQRPGLRAETRLLLRDPENACTSTFHPASQNRREPGQGAREGIYENMHRFDTVLEFMRWKHRSKLFGEIGTTVLSSHISEKSEESSRWKSLSSDFVLL